ncbi:PAF acetylhydrolase [Aspergillus steynii IBT 23096]|uniref:Putative phospholipase n=1 Tax=Aspergillus steynii IBT 23096 TaxID=1392250 RepID=A0A2I2GFI3_9EURO|nr:PAF acetylhydrolase [Aspergillus steynii IBT 23096]PLB51646.1 PAF acetylhydrolase [Aspergillus steynii IBT 23096]
MLRQHRLPPFLRPRLTWRYLLSSAAVLYITYCLLAGQPFFSSDMPPYSGPYAVGTVDLEVPRPPRRAGEEFFRDGSPAFELETVLFSVYYPASEGVESTKPRHPWISKPVSLTAEGYLSFANLNNFFLNPIATLGIWGLVGGREIPAEVDVPLASSEKDIDREVTPDLMVEPEDKFPVLIFSHGYASSRTDYTKYLGELASRGYVVAAVEHRDGSCPGTMIMRTDDGSEKPLYSFGASDIERLNDLDRAEFKQLQLEMRQLEMEETYQVLKAINEGNGSDIFSASSRNEGEDLESWKGRLDLDRLTVGGHSFGATLALRTLKGAPSEQFPARGAIVLDPGKSSGPLNHDVDVPTLIVHSDSWSRKLTIFTGRPHFDVVKALVEGIIQRGKDAWFMTSVGTSHPSVTDAPLIEPLLLSWTTGATIDVKEGVQQYVQTSLEFLKYLQDEQKRGILQETVSHPEYDQDIRDEKRRREQHPDVERYWQIHVSPVER